ncbi:copper resistance protein NlpE [Chitinophaga arvensicola]|uniref:Copper homeostasis protein (Lipoprotein) n=1 Tax=Chitinophaga arvensicola TaxID=29529 RepID=A0A1I0PGU9_9BACT|nr:copper resistance protein NlpE [Chitinophaga arvensicola]SEW13427.1 copper homeostasis protein (lipoprotein) [Chitinophaga arvensicola]
MKHLPLLLLLIVFAACQSTGKAGRSDSTALDTNADTATSVTYSGTLPCADCSGIVTELTLQKGPDHHFSLKETYQGKNQTFPSEGTYKIVHGSPSDPAATVIQLNPDKDKNLQRYYQQVDDNELKLLDSDQKTIQSGNNYTLKKVL